MADGKQQATTNSALPFGSEAKQTKAFHSFTAAQTSQLLSSTRRCHVVAMAALIQHELFKSQLLLNLRRFLATKPNKVNPLRKIPPKIENQAKSLAAKGFLRSQKPYSPPEDVSNKFKQICTTILGSETKISDVANKVALLTACQREFNHAVPNSLLHSMETTNDVLEFYKTPVNTTVPLDMMKNIDLPENVHIQFDYNRFHPDTDSMFNGVTAFPRSSTLVTGLKYKDKYPGHEARTTWPYNT